MKKILIAANLFFALLIISSNSFAQAADSAAAKPLSYISKHSIKIDGKAINYNGDAIPW